MSLKRVHGRAASGGFSAANYWNGGNVEPQGSTTMSRIVVLSPIRELEAYNQGIFAKAAGWYFYWRSNRRYRFTIDDGGGTPRNLDLVPTVVPQKDECVIWCGSYNETILINYAKGESSSSGPWVGYTPAGGNLRLGEYAGLYGVDIRVLACLATDTYALSVEQMRLAEAALKEMLEQGQDIYRNLDKLPGSGWRWVWDARHIDHGKGEWVDDVSGVVLSEVGRTQDHYVIPRFV